jgi:hypothetical protein
MRAKQAAEKAIAVKGTAFTGCRKAQLSEAFCGFPLPPRRAPALVVKENPKMI